MPKKDGWEVLKTIRSNPATKDLPVIVLTGLIDNQDMKKAYDLGANYYITKPFTPSQLHYGTLLMFDEVEGFWKA
jgi:putative two-component system response regulator